MRQKVLNILLLTHKFFPDIGGIETISEILAYQFCGVGYNVHVLTWSNCQNEKQFPFVVYRKPSIKRIIFEHAWADLIFENNPCLRLSWPNIFFRRPTVIGLQTWISKEYNGRVLEFLKKKWLNRAKAVISCSEAIRSKCWPLSTVIGNPYHDSIFKIKPNTQRRRDFVFVGRLVSDKGGIEAVTAFYELVMLLREQDFITKAITLSIVGDGPERKNLEHLINRFGISELVYFTGALRGEELASYLNQHRFILIPSKWEEPFGIVALEGMACGCIPIVSNGGGLPDAVGTSGLIFQRNNLQQLLTQMQKLLTDPSLENNLRSTAPAHLNKFKAKEVAKKYIEVIEASISD